MAIATTRSRVVYVKEEVTQGVAVEPTAGSDAIAILADGFDFNGEKELVERNVLTSSIAQQIPRTGIKTATGSIGVEWKAKGVEGDAPETYPLFKSLLGYQATRTATTTKSTGNTASELQLEDADVVKYKVGDIVLVKEAGAFHVSPIKTITTTPGAAKIELLRAKEIGAFSNSVVISKALVSRGVNSGHSYLTVTSYLDDVVKYQSAGCLVSSMSLENFTVGQIPTLSFGLEGITYNESIEKYAATSTSGTSPSTDISAGTDSSFNISLDGQDPVLVTLTGLIDLDNGADIAAEMQTQINAAVVSGSVTVAFTGGLYVITSTKKGAASSVVITDALTNNVADDLKIGVLNGGVEVAGVNGNGLTAAFDQANPPIALGACVFIDGEPIDVTECALTVENTVGQVTSTCNPNGIQSTRITQRAVSGNFTAYQNIEDVDMFDKFDNNVQFSLYLVAGIPSETAGEFKDVVAMYVPSAIITGKPVADADGIATLNVDFQCGFNEASQTDFVVASI